MNDNPAEVQSSRVRQNRETAGSRREAEVPENGTVM